MKDSRQRLRPPSRCRRLVPLWARGACALACFVVVMACQPQAPLEEWTLELEQDTTIGAEPVTLQTALYRPRALGFDHRGNVFVLDAGNHRVQVFDPDGVYLRTIGEAGSGPGQLTDPQGMFVHGDGRVWIADTHNRRIQPYTAGGSPLAPLTLEFFPLDLVVAQDRIFVQRMPQTNMVYGPDPQPLISVLDPSGNLTGGFVEPVSTAIGILYMLENMLALAPAPNGGIAVSNTHFSSRIRAYGIGGSLVREIPVLYKAGAWAPLGRRPAQINDASLARLARTSSALAWDAGRQLFWVLAGYVDQTPEGEWIIGREVYRYNAAGEYRGSLMLPQRAIKIAAGPDGRFWTIDMEGIVRAFRVTDPDTAPQSQP